MADDPAGCPDPPVVEQRGEGLYVVRLFALDYRTLLSPGRRGEVAMVIQRNQGWVLLQTKHHYPPGTFRLPTGTVGAGEIAEQAMLRELHEEANLIPGQVRRLCRLEYRLQGGRQDFATDAFLIESPQGVLHPNDLDEAIGAWREARLPELRSVARELACMEGRWRGWGLFRSVLHRIVARELGVPEEE